MEVKQTEKFVLSGPMTSWAHHSINVFGGPIFKRSMICQDLDSIGANPRLITCQSAAYGVGFLLERRPLHLVWGWLPGQKCKRVMVGVACSRTAPSAYLDAFVLLQKGWSNFGTCTVATSQRAAI